MIRMLRSRTFTAILFSLVLLGAPLIEAGPSAHGPEGKHHDQSKGGLALGSRAGPRFEAQSSSFELVGKLEAGELSLLIDRFATNEPVLGARVEVDSEGSKVQAKFHADIGDYAIDDAAMIQKLSNPGEHRLMITVTVAQERDSLDAVLRVDAIEPADSHHEHWEWQIAGSAVALALLTLAIFRFRRRAIHRSMFFFLVTGLASMSAALIHQPAGAHGPQDDHADGASYRSASGPARMPDGSVNVPKLAQRRMGLRTQIAPESEAAATVQLPARVVVDPNASGQVQSVHGGRVEPGPRGLPFAGQAVQRGEVLALVHHHADPFAVAAQQSQRAELRAARDLAQQKLQRLELLQGTVPRKEIEAARIDAQSLAEREERIAASLEAREWLRAPVSGVIARAELKAGQIVQAREVLIEIVDPSRLMVEATTPDASLGQSIGSASLAGIEGISLQLVGAARALRDGVLPISFRVSAAAKAHPLAVGQPVTLIATLKARRKGIVLPASAVVRSASNEIVVWVKPSAERFLPQPVQIQHLDAKTVLVVQGLAPDQRVLVQGAGLIAQIR